MAVRRRHRWPTAAALVTLALASGLVAGCTDQAGDPLEETFDGKWVLAEGTGPAGDLDLDVGLEEHARVTLRIAGTDWSGTAACNTYSGTVVAEDGALTSETGFAVTEMACEPPELMAIEASYLAALTAVDAIELTSATDAADALTLTGPEALLRFTREPEAEPASDADAGSPDG